MHIGFWVTHYTYYLVCQKHGIPIFFPVNDDLYPTLKHKIESFISVFCVLAMVAFVTRLGFIYGFMFALKAYIMPYIVFAGWLAVVTHLHHTHPDVPWYRDPEWSFVKGALSTVDRDYGIIENIHHNIGTHVVHHLFSSIPHYNLIEATKAIRPVLGKHYRKTQENTISAMLTAFEYCRFVPDLGSMVYHSDWKEVVSNKTQKLPNKAD